MTFAPMISSRALLRTILALVVFSPALCHATPLPPGSIQRNPQLTPPNPFDDGAIPSPLFDASNAILTTGPQDISGGTASVDTVTTIVYDDGLGVTGYEYRIVWTGASPLTSFNMGGPDGTWDDLAVLNVGSDALASAGSGIVPAFLGGSSTPYPAAGPSSWSDGDPLSISRDGTGNIGVIFNSVFLGQGTELDSAGSRSARIWFEVPSGDTKPVLTTMTLTTSGGDVTATILAPQQIPEPTTLALCGIGVCVGMIGFRRKRRT